MIYLVKIIKVQATEERAMLSNREIVANLIRDVIKMI